jgi:predicted ATPase
LLKDRWEQAQERLGQIILIVGEAGLGKSRLVRTLTQLVEGQAGEASLAAAHEPADPSVHEDSPVIEWRCSQPFQNSELHPVSDFVQRRLGFGRDQPSAARFDRLAQHLEGYGLGQPECVALFAKLLFVAPDERYPTAGLTPAREREETFRALRRWLRACSERRPVLFVVEDLHWADASSLEFLGQFIGEGLHDRILTVLTCRPEFKAPWLAAAHQTTLALNRLTRRQVTEWLRREAGEAVPETLVAQIYQRTDGLPLLVEEFTRLARESAVFELTTSECGPGAAVIARDIPATLQDLVLARLDRLSIDREVAQLAATLGCEFDYELLAAVATVNEMTLRAQLAKLVAAGILLVKGQPPQCTYFFRHALLEEALHGAMEGPKRGNFTGRLPRSWKGGLSIWWRRSRNCWRSTSRKPGSLRRRSGIVCRLVCGRGTGLPTSRRSATLRKA